MTAATTSTEREAEVCYVARLIEEGRTYWWRWWRTMYACCWRNASATRRTQQYITEDGALRRADCSLRPIQIYGHSRAGLRALHGG